MLGSTAVPHICWGSILALHVCRGSRVAAHDQGSHTCMFGINGGHMYIGDLRWPRINVRIDSGSACMLIINCGCVYMLEINGCNKCMLWINEGRTCFQFNGGCKH